jgi:transglutaminase-like putative cysteine protease
VQRLTVDHITHYRYAQPVSLGEHRLMFRPRDSHDLRLIEASLTVRPAASIRWLHDVFGNSVAIAEFVEPAVELYLRSTIVIDRYPAAESRFPIEPFAQTIPFSYPASEVPDLGRTIERHHSDAHRQVAEWSRGFLSTQGVTRTEDFLVAMTSAIREQFAYEVRYEEGVQVPTETLRRRAGSCRDFALFMMEAVRSVGLAARFVSGYLYDPALDGGVSDIQGAGATHAWVQVYLPGAGWVEFDPTNGILGGRNLVPVAVAREPSQALPVSGSFVGVPGDFLGMKVDVAVRASQANPEAA